MSNESNKDKELSELEASALGCVLEMASMELFIVDVGTCSSSPGRPNAIVRKKIRDLIEEIREEIKKKKTFNVLHKTIKEEAEERKNEEILQNEMKQNLQRIDDLKIKLKRQELIKLNEINKKQEIIANLKDKIQEDIAKNNVKYKYIERWEAARQSQNLLRCRYAEMELEQKLETVTNQCKNEIRVHDEIRKFLILEEQALHKEITNWKIKYDEEMKRRDEKIKVLRAKRKEHQFLLRDLWQLYEERKNDINDYLDFKEKIHREQDHNRYINSMATKIQAWWRGTMVRRGLGVFKKRKKLTKEKKKK